MQRSHILSVVLIAFLLVSIAACSGGGASDEPAAFEPVKIAVLNGPTGIGAVELMDMPEKYEVSVYQSPDEITGKIITGEVDVAAVPSNLAAVLYNKTEGQIVNLGPVALGVLYIVQNTEGSSDIISSIGDLRGKDVLVAAKGSTTEYILNKLLVSAGLDPESDVKTEWFSNHTEVNTALFANPGAVAMIPEPFVSVAVSKSENIKTVLDLNAEWNKATGKELPMSSLIAQKSFAEGRSKDTAILLSDYAASIKFVNESPDASGLIAEKGFIPDAEIAKKAIPGCNLVMFEDRQEGFSVLKAYYEILLEADPKSIGGNLPDEDFYH
ncbi:MAG: PhnD/SsuA/transferrin family substrate-binding protein [Clostridiales bacterium]|nr:PhnD/SsuA/transferrin family substrate-binding protein [Clostridiales bacterium]